jgi:predicted nuclease of predicted toxin-antitoxin system
MIIIDENVDQVLIDKLETCNYEVFSIRENNPGMNDREIIHFAKDNKGMIITEDKDFGELVFSYGIQSCTVIFLRYKKDEYDFIEKNIMTVLNEFYLQNRNFFITITKNKIRIRKI